MFYWLNVGFGIVVFVVVFWLSDVIVYVLYNLDFVLLIKMLLLVFIVIFYG